MPGGVRPFLVRSIGGRPATSLRRTQRRRPVTPSPARADHHRPNAAVSAEADSWSWRGMHRRFGRSLAAPRTLTLRLAHDTRCVWVESPPALTDRGFSRAAAIGTRFLFEIWSQ